jgi:aminoglycoside 3-N-acetyltransferase
VHFYAGWGLLRLGDNRTVSEQSNVQPKLMPEDLSRVFRDLNLSVGDLVMLHASVESLGAVEGGAAMVLLRLLRAIGQSGTLLMPAFTSVTTHSATHDNHTKPGCWCEGREDRHIPFIPELQPDKKIGDISHRLCSWPSSRRSNHPAYSYIAVGRRRDELVRAQPLADPLYPIRKIAAYSPYVLVGGVGFDSVTSIHLAEEHKTPSKFVRERALTMNTKGRTWLEVGGLGCSNGFQKIRPFLSPKSCRRASLGLATLELYPMNLLIETAESLLHEDPRALMCDNPACLSCLSVQN